ncbi:MAG: GDP-L-fucose synthase [Bacteroidota bacterium]
MEQDSKIYVAGHRGLVGSAILRRLQKKGYPHLVCRTHKELDLIDSKAVAHFFSTEKPEYVILAAAKVGGIMANNTYRADFIHDNLMIQNNVIHQSYVHGVKKLLFLGSTCIYPKNCPQPIKEEYMLTGELEYTNEPYAIAKIAGIKTCESYNLQYNTNFISVMPTNLYGPNDNFDLEKSHVLPALIRKMHLGKALENNRWEDIRRDLDHLPVNGVSGKESEGRIRKILGEYGVLESPDGVKIEIWGSGKPMREFLWSEDMADACVFLMENRDFSDCYDSKVKEIRNTHINIGTGTDISIADLARTIKRIIGLKGELYFNTEKPDGTLKKLTDSSKLHSLGWHHQVGLEEGIERIYEWYISTRK